jgi:hypothetical protein
MADLSLGMIDLVVVYKVDRLTRSLADFAKIVDVLDHHQAYFVSVTQLFSTTNSMGRLILNVLLSFAQFEREIAGERIRDKLRASKAKGMWMGGPPPIGYRIRARHLEVHKRDARIAQLIFHKFVELGSIAKVHDYLVAHRIKRSVQWTDRGKQIGGYVPSRGSLHHILQNRIYIGDVAHDGKAFQGQHQAIISQGIWAKAQQVLANGRRATVEARRANRPFLTGLLHDDKGHAMDGSIAYNSAKRKYRYYTSRPLLRRSQVEVGSVPRVSSRWIEGIVVDEIARIFPKQGHSRGSMGSVVRRIVDKVVVGRDRVEIHLRADAGEGIGENLDALPQNVISPLIVPARFVPWNGSTQVSALDGTIPAKPQLDLQLLRALACAHRFRSLLARGQKPDLPALVKACGLTGQSSSDVLRLAFLAPKVVLALIDPKRGNGIRLHDIARLAECANWPTQQRHFETLERTLMPP